MNLDRNHEWPETGHNSVCYPVILWYCAPMSGLHVAFHSAFIDKMSAVKF